MTVHLPLIVDIFILVGGVTVFVAGIWSGRRIERIVTDK